VGGVCVCAITHIAWYAHVAVTLWQLYSHTCMCLRVCGPARDALMPARAYAETAHRVCAT
jgi:hypothetical protein